MGHDRSTLSSINFKALGFIQRKGKKEKNTAFRGCEVEVVVQPLLTDKSEENCGLWHTALNSAGTGSGRTMFELSGAIFPSNRAYFKLP